jgi:chemotaxis methyl-accepting protein methylase
MRNNLLTYYGDELKISALLKLSGVLSPGGFLGIGSPPSFFIQSAPSLPPSIRDKNKYGLPGAGFSSSK